MLFDTNYLDLSGDLLSEMRLLVEGAITLFVDDTTALMRLARDHNEQEALSALNDIGGALYIMRRHIKRLQAEQQKAAMQMPSNDA